MSAKRFLWGGLALIILGMGGCMFGVAFALDPELEQDGGALSGLGAITFLVGLLFLLIGSFMKVFEKDD